MNFPALMMTSDVDGDDNDEDEDNDSIDASFESTESGSDSGSDSNSSSDSGSNEFSSTDDDKVDGDDSHSEDGVDGLDINSEQNDDDNRLSDRSGAILGEANDSGYGSSSTASESMDYYVKITLINMWLILGLIVIINIIFYWCYCRKQRRENKRRTAAEAFAEAPHEQVYDEEEQMI